MNHRSTLAILTVTAIAVGPLTAPATAATPDPLWHAYPLGHAPLSTDPRPTKPHILRDNSGTGAGQGAATKRPDHRSGSHLWPATAALAGILAICLLGAALRTTSKRQDRISDRRQGRPSPDPPPTTSEALGPQRPQRSRAHTPRRRNARRQGGDVPDQTQRQAKRDPLVEHAVPLLAKAMLTTTDRDHLWASFHDRVESECHRIEDTAIREALEPLRERFEIEAVARVATAMAQEKNRQEQRVTSPS